MSQKMGLRGGMTFCLVKWGLGLKGESKIKSVDTAFE